MNDKALDWLNATIFGFSSNMASSIDTREVCGNRVKNLRGVQLIRLLSPPVSQRSFGKLHKALATGLNEKFLGHKF